MSSFQAHKSRTFNPLSHLERCYKRTLLLTKIKPEKLHICSLRLRP